MAEIIHTHELDVNRLNADDKLSVYNGFDCLITHEVGNVTEGFLDSETRAIYDFERAMQAPALEMMLRGYLVDMELRQQMISELMEKRKRVEEILNQFSEAAIDAPLNARSPAQKAKFFYESMGLEPVMKRNSKGQRAPTTDREALEKLSRYLWAKPFCNSILKIMDLTKQLGTLQSIVDEDNHIRASYNVAATETGRWSSDKNAFNTGTNLQNWNNKHRQILTCPPGFKLAYIDLEQAESRAVGLIVWMLFGDSSYLDACESGDLHTTVCRMAWKDRPWTGDLQHDRHEVAEQKFYRDFSYRDMAKRLGHGTNYFGQPYTMAKHSKMDKAIIEEFQEAYFTAFPGIPRWHQWVIEQVQKHGSLTTRLGRRRQFFGRRTDDATIREAIAFEPQSFATGDYTNLGLWKVWQQLYPRVVCLGQQHDAIAIMYREEDEDELLPQAAKLLETELTFTNINGEVRSFVIPSEPASGWNLAKATAQNPDGIREWKGSDDRKRQRKPKTSVLDFRL